MIRLKVFHGETPKRAWPNVRQSYSGSCRGLGFPKLPGIKRSYPKKPVPRGIGRASNEQEISRYNKNILHGEMPVRNWPNLRGAFARYCAILGFSTIVIPRKQIPGYNKWYHEQNRESLNQKQARKARDRRKQFPEQEREKSNKKRRQMAKNPGWRMLDSLRSRVRMALKGTSKSARTMELVGCSIDEFRTHLESRFRPGMTWENYGFVWHVDHIKPCARFDLTDPNQQKTCFNWSNQQPLFALENLKKGAKYAGTD